MSYYTELIFCQSSGLNPISILWLHISCFIVYLEVNVWPDCSAKWWKCWQQCDQIWYCHHIIVIIDPAPYLENIIVHQGCEHNCLIVQQSPVLYDDSNSSNCEWPYHYPCQYIPVSGCWNVHSFVNTYLDSLRILEDIELNFKNIRRLQKFNMISVHYPLFNQFSQS